LSRVGVSGVVIEAFKSPARVLYGRQSRLKLADKGSIGSLALLIFDFFNDIDPTRTISRGGISAI
jgi:hypothetical protein